MSVESGFDNSLLTVSPSPHLRADDSVSKIMWTVTASLVPVVAFSIWHFGAPALITILVAVAAAVASEFAVLKIRKKTMVVSDGSALLTGLLLALCLPPSLPWYMTALGSAFAIVIAKHSMGGLGYNIFNPAHIGRAALMVSWPIAMTTWTSMQTAVPDAVSTATPLNILKQQGYAQLIDVFGSAPAMYKALFLGFRNGSIGETSTVLLLLGGAFLIYKGIINWEVPAFMIGTVGLCTWVFGPAGFFTGDPIFHMMAGGLVIGAFFMATDMVTIPITRKGQIVFAVGCGLITSLIRLVGGYPEGVCYAILLMNSLTPLIDQLVRPERFGTGGAR